jgi:hypothetical protein
MSAPVGVARRTSRDTLLRAGGEAAVVLVAAFAAAVATTWPLVLHLGSYVHNGIDSPFQAWTIDHVQWAVTGHGSLWDANIFHPNRHTLAYSDSLIGVAVPLLPLRWLGLNPIAQLNIALLIGLTASAASGYLLGRVVSGRRAVGALTAVAFAFGPFEDVSTGHVHGTVHAGVALAATGAWWLADRVQRHASLVAPLALLVGSVVWQMSVSFYPGAYAVVAVLLVLVVRARDLGRRGLLASAGGLVACGAATLILMIPYIQVVREGRPFAQSTGSVAGLGANFTAVNERLALWGGILGNDRVLAPAFPGVALLLLAAVGLVFGLRSAGRQHRTATTGLVFVVIGSFLALGTASHGWRSYSPYRVLFEFVPGFSALRATYRAWIIGLIGLGLLAGLGCVGLGRWLAARERTKTVGVAVVAAVVVLAVLVEGFASWGDRPRAAVSKVDRALEREPRSGGVLYLPALVQSGPLAAATTFGQVENVFGTTAHHRDTPNGYSGLAPREFRSLSARMRALPSSRALDELRSLGVRFVVVRGSVGGTPWEQLLDPPRAAPLRLVGRYGSDVLYEVPSR